MMSFNETQQYLYQVSWDFLVDKLETTLEKSKKSQSALNAMCFLLYVTLKHDHSTVEKMSEVLYPEKEYKIVRNIFLEIHDLLNNKRPDHSLIKSITDPRFFSDTSKIAELQQTITKSLKEDLEKWLQQKYETNVVSHQTILDLEQHYSQVDVILKTTSFS